MRARKHLTETSVNLYDGMYFYLGFSILTMGLNPYQAFLWDFVYGFYNQAEAIGVSAFKLAFPFFRQRLHARYSDVVWR
jgi:hypothetical protein